MTRAKSKSVEADAADQAVKPRQQESARETLESIVVAFVLAFLFRTFIAEAFVIPTGSMAPTLFGRHKDVACPQCGQHYEVGASEELDDDGNFLLRRITHATCPNCRFEADIKDLAVFKGDRILVNKFPYEMGDPQRWDVCVFKFPEIPERNYIKRMIGLPGEAIRINRGDISTRKDSATDFHIQRKDDPNKQDILQILVYDDANAPTQLLEKGWPERWTAMQPGAGNDALAGWLPAENSWTIDPAKRRYLLNQATSDWQWLRYQHRVPEREDWAAVQDRRGPNPHPRPQLITDYYGYNSISSNSRDGSDDDVFWVGDLTISGVVDIVKSSGSQPAIMIELVEGVRRYRCEIDLTSSQATLSHTDELNPGGAPVVLGTAPTSLRGTGRHRFRFANVDDRLCVWIDGSLVPFGRAAEYQPAALLGPQPADLTPVGIAVRDTQAVVAELLLRRDIYYRAELVANDDRFGDVSSQGEKLTDSTRIGLRRLLVDPLAYGQMYAEKCGPVEFSALKDDEFFVMGDNSPRSQDSRLWTNRRGAENRHAVPRRAFVGKAFVIYWPHGIPFLNDGKGYPLVYHWVPQNPPVENYPAYTAPFYPQFGRWMSRIR